MNNNKNLIDFAAWLIKNGKLESCRVDKLVEHYLYCKETNKTEE
jgi:hypothetical protein